MEEKMMQFVQWLSEKLKVTPGEVVQMLNEAPEEEVKKYTDLFLAETTQETEKFKSGGKINAAVAKFQNGGNLTRREALDAFIANNQTDDPNKKVTRADARRALRSAKLSFDNNNMTGDRNQFARSVIAGRLQTPKDADVISTPTLSFSSLIKPQIPLTEQYTIPNMAPRVIERPVEDDNVDLSGISFNNIFAAARKAGVSEFSWNGNRYNTNLAEGRVDVAQKPVTTVTTKSITTPSSEESKTYPILSEPYGFNLTNVNKRWAPAWIKTGEGWPGNYHSGYMVDLTNVDPEIALRTISGIVGVQEHGDIIKQHMTKEQMKKFNTPRPTTMAPYRKLQH